MSVFKDNRAAINAVLTLACCPKLLGTEWSYLLRSAPSEAVSFCCSTHVFADTPTTSDHTASVHDTTTALLIVLGAST